MITRRAAVFAAYNGKAAKGSGPSNPSLRALFKKR